MKLKKLEVNGFKSFDQKTTIEFPPGISAVVGPNGCGKSNIVDALRWVMGEQSVKQLRGKSMEDIIFAGANGKPPLNMAEVSLTLINDNGSAPEELKDFSEIMVTRRLYRSGESAYMINKQPCRLKDVHNVFMGSGLGAKSYAVIQQGNIGAITEAGPEERRYFIEEAAGVTRFINRKNEALRKVQSTNQNLIRISDIIAEVNRQMNSLKRQARKAELYNKYKGIIKELDTRLASHYYDGYRLKINETDRLIKDLKDTDIEQTTQLKKLDAAIERIKQERWQKNQEISDQKNIRFETQRNIDRSENDLAHLRKDVERIGGEIHELKSASVEIEQKNQRIQSDIDEVQSAQASLQQKIQTVDADLKKEAFASEAVRNQLADFNQALENAKKELMDHVTQEARYKNIYQNASNNKENLKSRLKQTDEEEVSAGRKVAEAQEQEAAARGDLDRIRQTLRQQGDRIEAAKEQLDARIKTLGSQVKQVQTLDFDRNKMRSQFTALKKMEENYDWYKDGVKSIMKSARQTDDAIQQKDSAGQPRGIVGLMADIVRPMPSYEVAVEAALGESLQYILVQDQQAGSEAIDYLQRNSTGRSGFIPLSSVKNLCGEKRKKPESAELLLNYVQVKKGFEHVAEAILGHVVLAENLGEALALFNRNGVVQTIVTQNGDIVSPQGLMIGGNKENLAGILKKKQEINDLEGQLLTLDQKLETAHKQQTLLETEVRKLEIQLQQLIELKNEIAQNEIEAEKSLYKSSEELKHARRHLEIVRLEQEQLLGEESDLNEEISGYHAALAEIQKDVALAQKNVAQLTEQVATVSSTLEDSNQKNLDLKLKLTSLNARLENNSNTLNRLQDYQEEGLHRLKQISQEIILKDRKQTDCKRKIGEIEQNLSRMYNQIKQVEDALETNESAYVAIDNQLKENDGMVSEIQNRREETLQKIRLLEVEHSQQVLKQENIKHRIEEQYRLPFAELKTLFDDTKASSLPEDMAIEEMEAELSKTRDKIAKIVDVNLSAIKEYEELKTRFDFLSEQRDDLVQSVEDLHKVIAKINKITKQRFLETFDLVNAKLAEVFPRLFEGGTAKLVLTEPGKPLETGVEFMVHPPGKKLTRLSLLSGGEKALSAIAFIFSIFLIKPASFCLMDEIDAPLDDVNVYRFNDLLKIIGEKSQIVMITHNKNSMEFADTLFGVTMENKGVSKIVSVNFQQQNLN